MGRTSSPGQPVTLVHGSSRKAWEDLLCALPAVARGPSQETRSLIPSRGLTSGNGVRYDYPWGQLNSGFWLRELEHLRILEWVAFPFSRGSSQPRDPTQVSRIAGRFFTTEPPGKPKNV